MNIQEAKQKIKELSIEIKEAKKKFKEIEREFSHQFKGLGIYDIPTSRMTQGQISARKRMHSKEFYDYRVLIESNDMRGLLYCYAVARGKDPLRGDRGASEDENLQKKLGSMFQIEK